MNETATLQPIPLRDVAPWLLFGVILLLQLFVAAFDQGTLPGTGTFMHELLHDGRHLLGFPCH